jgi:hypothetical protein
MERRNQRGNVPPVRPPTGRRAQRCAAAFALLVGFLPAGRTDSTFRTAPASGGPVSASAHLDFRITILPSLGLAMSAQGMRVQASGGALTLQGNTASAWDGTAPSRSVQLRAPRQSIDTLIPTSQFGSAGLITIASP